VFKKRPRPPPTPQPDSAAVQPLSKTEPEYWERRLFKNTFTYKGRRREVKNWSIKLQLFGRRKTFALTASDRAQAAVEACHIYQTIQTQGWDAVGQRRGGAGFLSRAMPPADGHTAAGPAWDEAIWRRRLIHRRYPEPKSPPAAREFSVRIEHAGTSRYFPLHTADENQGAAEALRIHRTVVEQGWAVANQKYARELTVALRWLEDPLAWTYTTFHTWISGQPLPALARDDGNFPARHVAIIEPDAGIRFALAACANSQDGFRCGAVCANAAEAAREIPRRKVDLVLVNFALPDQSGPACVQELQRLKPAVIGLCFSVFEDSDQLFKSTPGGATGYLLKRTPAHRIFDPIADLAGVLTRELIAAKIREYFQRLIAAMPSGPSAVEMARLTPREHEILALLAKGDLAKEIADALGISIWTVHGHIKNIFEKLDVHTRTEAVVKFLQK
jgi:DNA-binding NarL/FixJ family response regulator